MRTCRMCWSFCTLAALALVAADGTGGAERPGGLVREEDWNADQLKGGASICASPGPVGLDAAIDRIPGDARALVLLDARLHERISRDLLAYVQAAAARRKFPIALLPVAGLDDRAPPEVRRALQAWHASRPGLEGILFVGNVKLPSFFMPRVDTPSTRLWPRYFEDLDMAPERRIPPGTILEECGPGRSWPCVAGRKEFKVPEHDFDAWTPGPSQGPELWAAFLPVGFPDDSRENYEGWAKQLAPFFRKAIAFHDGSAAYERGLYLVSNDVTCLARSRPVWDTVGPKEIEFYSINEKGAGAFKDNPAGYIRTNLEKFSSLDDFLTYAGKLPWMDEGWQSSEIFLSHMKGSRRRFVWWNVHSDPGTSLISFRQARDMEGGGLIALLNGCSVGGFRQPGSGSWVDVESVPENNVMVQVVYGRSAFLAALGTPHNRVDDEHATPLFECMYSGGYLGMAHLRRVRQQDKDSPDPGALRGRQEMLIGDPFLDARSTSGSTPAGDAWRPTQGWFTLHHDAARTGRTESSPGAPFEHLWHNEHWDELIAPEAEPIMAEGLVFYGTFRGFLRGVEADTGKEVWRVDLGLPIRHAPAYDGGRVYAATLGRSGFVAAFEARTGKEAWRYRPERPGGFAASPAVDGGAVFIGDRAGVFHAIEAASGRPRWKADLGALILQTASIQGGRVAVAAEDLVPRLLDAATGKEIWHGPQMDGFTVRAYYPFFWRDLVVWRTDTGAMDAYHGDIVAATEEGRKYQETREKHGWSARAEEIVRGLVASYSEEKYRREQEYVQRRMREGAHKRSFYAFRVTDGSEPVIPAVGYHASENGYSVPAPSPQDADGNLYVFTKSIFSEWNYPIRAFDAVSILDPGTGLPALIRRIDRSGGSFPATSDESNNLTVAGDKLFDTHDHVLAYMELGTRKVVNAFSSHAPELWGGVFSAHATNGPNLPRESPGRWNLRDPSVCLEFSIQWNGPAQGAVAVHGDKVWWITGSMVVCLRGKP